MSAWRLRSRRNAADYDFAPYVSKAEKQARADEALRALAQVKGTTASPVRLRGHAIATTFWGKGWCRNIESFADFRYRLDRGRSYLRAGAVVDLQIRSGLIEARVQGSELYQVRLAIAAVPPARWKTLVARCAGAIDSVIELLSGQLSGDVMAALAAPRQGLFPEPGEMELACSCPDQASCCKHVAAALYGVGARLDHAPELLFTLRGADQAELVRQAGSAGTLTAAGDDSAAKALADQDLGAIFGVEMDAPAPAEAPPRTPARRRLPAGRRTAAPAPKKPSRPARPPPAPRLPATLTAADLLALGIPRSTFANWIVSGVLGRTRRRGVYARTSRTAAAIARARARTTR